MVRISIFCRNWLYCLIAIGLCVTCAQAFAESAPVLMTFDVEMDADAAALESINLTENATYFILGEFVEKYPDLVVELTKKGTIGSHSYSHPHLTELTQTEIRKELLLSKLLLEKATGQVPIWFRSPYLEYHEAVFPMLRELGFQFDSSDQERWVQQTVLKEIPISNGYDEGTLASDWDLFEKKQMTDSQVLKWLERNYRERMKTGSPFVILLHPRIIAQHKTVLDDFIEYVKQSGGNFLSYDEYLQISQQAVLKRLGVWVDFSLGDHNLELMIEDLKGAGFTDVFLMAKSPEGTLYFRTPELRSEGFEDLFGTALKLLKKEGFRVHAWIPVNVDRQLVSLHPEWAMVAQNGTPSNEWLSPIHPEFRRYIFRTVFELLTQYDLDGIHLDYIRFPGLDYDFAPHVIEAFIRDTGINLPKEKFTQSLLNQHYITWTNWRTQQISTLVEEIRGHAELRTGKRIVFSAALLAQSVTSYRVMDAHGQDFGQLANHLDIIIPMAYFKEEQRPVQWVQNVNFASKLKVGTKLLFTGISAYQKPETWEYSAAEFGEALQYAGNGTEGVVIYPYLYLFGRGDPEWNMPTGSPRLIRSIAPGLEDGVGPNLSRMTTGLRTKIRDQWLRINFIGKSNYPISLVMAFFILALGILFVCQRKHRRNLIVETPHLSFDPNKDWRQMEFEIKNENITGQLCAHVSHILHKFGSQKVSRYRIAFILEALTYSSGSLEKLVRLFDQIPGWGVLGGGYLQEASLLGYIVLNNGSAHITDEGRQVLHRAKSEGFCMGLWEFIEKRLHETLMITCPNCSTENSSHWYWTSLDCSGCNRNISVQQCTNIHLKPPEISLNMYKQ